MIPSPPPLSCQVQTSAYRLQQNQKNLRGHPVEVQDLPQQQQQSSRLPYGLMDVSY